MSRRSHRWAPEPEPDVPTITTGLDWANVLASRFESSRRLFERTRDPTAQQHILIGKFVQDVQLEVLGIDKEKLMLIYERDDHDDEIAQLEKAHEMQMQSLESINADWIQELMRKHEKEMAAFKDAFGGALRNLCGLGLGQIAVASSLCNIMQWLRDLLQLEDPC